jgi:hypothetical protein
MLRLDWTMLVAGTVLGILSLTADLIGIGGFRGFGWKQIVGTAAAAVLVGVSTWRILRSGGRGAP